MFLKGVVGAEVSADESASVTVPASSSSSSHTTLAARELDTAETGDTGNDEETKSEKGKGKEQAKEPTVWRVTFAPQEGVSVRVLDEEEVDDVKGGEDRVGFLPRWFWEEMQAQENVQSLQMRPEVGKKDGAIPPGWQI